MRKIALLFALLSLAALFGCEGETSLAHKGTPAPAEANAEAITEPALPSTAPAPSPQETDAYNRLDATLGETQQADPDALFFNAPQNAPKNPRIVIRKAARQLEFYDGETLLGRFRIALGKEPVGAKEREGDNKTPEGDYYVCMRNEQSRYHLSLGLSYPSDADARRGLDAGLIDQGTYEAIVSAIAQQKQPPWNSALGGEICIHGGGTASDWTAGCIALSNADIETLFALCPAGTPVRIEE